LHTSFLLIRLDTNTKSVGQLWVTLPECRPCERNAVPGILPNAV
jgi:hypothetical protein